jgi:hypothetical protein
VTSESENLVDGYQAQDIENFSPALTVTSVVLAKRHTLSFRANSAGTAPPCTTDVPEACPNVCPLCTSVLYI